MSHVASSVSFMKRFGFETKLLSEVLPTRASSRLPTPRGCRNLQRSGLNSHPNLDCVDMSGNWCEMFIVWPCGLKFSDSVGAHEFHCLSRFLYVYGSSAWCLLSEPLLPRSNTLSARKFFTPSKPWRLHSSASSKKNVCSLCPLFVFAWMVCWCPRQNPSTAQGGGRSFKDRTPIGEIGRCDSQMAKRIHWWTERWLKLCFLEGLQWLQWACPCLFFLLSSLFPFSQPVKWGLLDFCVTIPTSASVSSIASSRSQCSRRIEWQTECMPDRMPVRIS